MLTFQYAHQSIRTLPFRLRYSILRTTQLTSAVNSIHSIGVELEECDIGL